MARIQMHDAEDLVLTPTEMNFEEFLCERRRGESRWADSVLLREERLRAMEHISRLGLAITGFVADVERGHDGGP